MNRALILSLSLNGVLLPLSGWMFWQHAGVDEKVMPPQEIQAQRAEEAAVVPAMLPPARAPFHWRELESPDFPIFIANLRAIGCPEQTIRHLIDGELRAVYAEKGSALASRPTADAITIEQERLAVLEHLLQPVSSTRSTASSSTKNEEGSMQATQAAAGASSSPTTALIDSIPAAFLVGDDGSALSQGQLSTTVTDERLAPEDAAQIARLRDDFEASVLPQGQSPPAPDSPEYRRKWRKAQQDSDDRFSSLYGGDALDALYRQRLLQASQAATSAAK
jgi:hypothetical protein